MGRRKEQEGAEGGTRERLGHGQDIGKYPEHQRRITQWICLIIVDAYNNAPGPIWIQGLREESISLSK